MEIDITLLIQWFFAVALVAATGWFVVQVIKGVSLLTPDARYLLDEFAEAAVRAAEQKFLHDEDASGQTKLQYALNAVYQWCQANHIKYDRAVVEPLVEAKVYELLNWGRDVFEDDGE